MRKRLLVIAVAFAVSIGIWGSFARSTADAQCGASCGLMCGNRCSASCFDCTISECGAAAGACCQQLWEKEGSTPDCPGGVD